MLQEIEGLFVSMERIVSLRTKLLATLRSGHREHEPKLRLALATQVGVRDTYASSIASQMGLERLPLSELLLHLSAVQQSRLQTWLDRDRELARQVQTVGCRQAWRKRFLQTLFCA